LKTLTVIADRAALEAGFIKALADSTDTVRAEAARWLGQYESEPALKPLRDLLINDVSDKVRSRAAYALAYIEPDLETLAATDTAGIDALLTGLSDNERSVRLRVIWALGQLKSAAALRSLTNIVESETANYHEKQTAVEALGSIGDANAVETLVVALQFDRHEGVRGAAAEALGKMRDQRSLPFLIHSLQDDVIPAVRASAAKALEELGETSANEPLIIALGDSSTDVRFRAAQALRVVGDSRAIEPLNLLVADEQSGKRVRQAAERALEALNHQGKKP
jgi:HEAT repeat protein